MDCRGKPVDYPLYSDYVSFVFETRNYVGRGGVGANEKEETCGRGTGPKVFTELMLLW